MFSFLKQLFSSSNKDELTNTQWYFPYFFDEKEFARKCRLYGYEIEVKVDAKSGVPNDLILHREGKLIFQFKIWTQLTFDGDCLIAWKIKDNIIDFTKCSLPTRSAKSFTLDLSSLEIGGNVLSTKLPISNFVTYVRKTSIKYDIEFCDCYSIVIVDGIDVRIIPFNWFNTSNPDGGYVWPATARINLGRNYLMGEGMRMSPFVVNLKTGELLGS